MPDSGAMYFMLMVWGWMRLRPCFIWITREKKTNGSQISTEQPNLTFELIRKTNHLVHSEFPGVATIAEESTAWPKVTQRLFWGLGFTFKWNMGWMHDTLKSFQIEPRNDLCIKVNSLRLNLSWAWKFSASFTWWEYAKRSLLGKAWVHLWTVCQFESSLWISVALHR